MSINNERKKSIQQAIANYTNKQNELSKPKNKKKNNDPEAQVAKACCQWLKAHGFDGQIYESKSQLIDGVWRKAGMNYGTCDWQGDSAHGFATYIEFKAPGKRSTFWREGNERQVDYLINKIDRGSFAVVVDSAELLAENYRIWIELKSVNPNLAREYLFDSLPPKPKKRGTNSDAPLFVD